MRSTGLNGNRSTAVEQSTKLNGNGSTDIEQSLENDIGANIRALTRTSGALHRPENGNGETSGDNLEALLREVSEASARQVESLIDELHEFRRKLESQSERIQSDIASYVELSQNVAQLTTIISDNLKRLPASLPSAVR